MIPLEIAEHTQVSSNCAVRPEGTLSSFLIFRVNSTHPMSTLASSRTEPLVPSAPRARGAGGTRDSQSNGAASVVFIVASLAVHLGALSAFASSPSLPSDRTNAVTELVIDLAEPEVVRPPSPSQTKSMPLGQLEQSEEASAPTVRPPALGNVSAHRSEQPLPQVEAGDAPSLVTADNPYASSVNVFSKGGVAPFARVVSVSAQTQREGVSASFGVEHGSAEASDEAKRALAAWYGQVRAQLARSGTRAYPLRARKLGQQGTSKVSVRISEKGRLLDVSLSSSSGHTLLDQAALNGLSRLDQVDAPPRGAGSTTLIVPVTFRLN